MPDELQQKFEEVNDLMTELTDIQKRRPLVHAMYDLSEWLERKLNRVNMLMDEIEYEVKERGLKEPVQEKEESHEHAVTV